MTRRHLVLVSKAALSSKVRGKLRRLIDTGFLTLLYFGMLTWVEVINKSQKETTRGRVPRHENNFVVKQQNECLHVDM